MTAADALQYLHREFAVRFGHNAEHCADPAEVQRAFAALAAALGTAPVCPDDLDEFWEHPDEDDLEEPVGADGRAAPPGDAPSVRSVAP